MQSCKTDALGRSADITAHANSSARTCTELPRTSSPQIACGDIIELT